MFLTLCATAVLAYVLLNWQVLPFLQRMTGLLFFFIVLHTWEELRFPGGFVELVESKINIQFKDRHFGETVLVTLVFIIFIPPLLFPNLTMLVMAPMIIGVFEIIAHTAAIKMFKLNKPYSPGLATAAFLLFPLSAYTIYYTIEHHLMAPINWLFSFLYMLFSLAIAQQFVVRGSGMKYRDFLRHVLKKPA